MKRIMLLVIGSMIGFVTSCKGAEGLVLSIEPSVSLFTSESIPFQVVFSNTSDSALTILKPVLGRDLVVRVFNNKNAELARSTNKIEYQGIYWGDTPVPDKRYFNLKPGEVWKTESFDLFKQTSPSFNISPSQIVRVSATYLLDDKEYEGNIAFIIPEHDFEIKPNYISSDKALSLARQALEEKGFKIDTLKGIEPTVECINGVYRVTYARTLSSEEPRVRGGSPMISLQIDASSGVVLQVSGGRR